MTRSTTSRSRAPWAALMCALFVAGMALLAPAGVVERLHAFTPGEIADANDVNENFGILRAEINDNAVRVRLLENYVDTGSVHFPARALAYDPTASGMAPASTGLQWHQDSFPSGRIMFSKPANYVGDGAELTVYFSLLSPLPTGVVDFSLLCGSARCGAGGAFEAETATLQAPGVIVSGVDIFCQTFAVPEALLSEEIWIFSLKRDAAESTYTDDIVVHSVKVEYPSTP